MGRARRRPETIRRLATWIEYRLLIDLQAIEFLNGLTRKARNRILDHLRKIRSFPSNYSDYYELDPVGRRVEISICAGFAVHYWIDVADQHVKVLALKSADR